MNTSDRQDEERRLAQIIGDAPLDCARDANDDVAMESVAATVRDWAREASPGFEELDIARIADAPDSTPSWRRLFHMRSLAWPLAFAVMAVAIAQSSFVIRVGDTTIAWGTVGSDGSDRSIAELKATIAELQAQSLALAGQVESVSSTTVQLTQTAAQLARNQQAETLTRYQDMQSLMQLASQRGNGNP